MEVCNRLVKVCVLSLLLWSAFAFAAELYVPSDAYRTIQAAINAANSGDTIIVAAGTYRENLNITKSITIRGVDKDSVILDPLQVVMGLESRALVTASLFKTSRSRLDLLNTL